MAFSTTRLKCLGTWVMVAAALACADTPTPPTEKPMRVPAEVANTLVDVGGYDYYEDDVSGELIPTSTIPARIVNQKSEATITCNDTDCSALFKAYHEGNWHRSTQILDWKILEGGGSGTTLASGSQEKTGGVTCTYRLASMFCTDKKQENEHSASATVAGCSAQARVSTAHRADWGMLVTIGVGVISINRDIIYGVTPPISTHAEDVDQDRCTECDNPNTPEIEECGSDTGSTSGTPTGSGGGPCPECITEPIDEGPSVCYYRYWYRIDTGEEITRVWLYCL